MQQQHQIKKLQPLISKPVSNIMAVPNCSPRSSIGSVQPTRIVPTSTVSSGNETFKQELQKMGILNSYEVVWTGDLVFKSKPTPVDFHYLKGNKSLVKNFLNFMNSNNPRPNSLALLNRLKLELPQIKTLFQNLNNNGGNPFLINNATILLAVANIPNSALNDGKAIRSLEDHLQVQLVKYFHEKKACGVVSTPNFNNKTANLYLFSRSSSFVENVMGLHGGRMWEYLRGSEYPYLMVVFFRFDVIFYLFLFSLS